MDKINFVNGSTPALNSTNLNKLQDNVEDAIQDLEDSENAKIKTTETTSDTDTYSCNYINDIAEDVYSTSETKTNKVWTDGKPIYRKVISFTTPSTNNSDFTIGSLSNVDEVISLKGIVDNGLPIPCDWNNTYSIAIRFSSGTITGRLVWDSYINKNGFIIIEYTKTTD